jgi:hypothetical protein
MLWLVPLTVSLACGWFVARALTAGVLSGPRWATALAELSLGMLFGPGLASLLYFALVVTGAASRGAVVGMLVALVAASAGLWWKLAPASSGTLVASCARLRNSDLRCGQPMDASGFAGGGAGDRAWLRPRGDASRQDVVMDPDRRDRCGGIWLVPDHHRESGLAHFNDGQPAAGANVALPDLAIFSAAARAGGCFRDGAARRFRIFRRQIAAQATVD